MSCRNVIGEHTRHHDSGFTLLELMVVVLILGIMVSIAIPVYTTAQRNARRKACYSNQRSIEGAAYTWVAQQPGNLSDLQGVVDASHQLITMLLLRGAPRCTSAPEPATPGDLDASTGAYTLDASGSVIACGWGGHGYYRD